MVEVSGSICDVQAGLHQAHAIPEEFLPAALLGWSDRLLSLETCPAVVGLIRKLEAMSRVRLSGCDRALLLHLLEGPVQRTFDRMPRMGQPLFRVVARHGWDRTMEQRLAEVVYRNFGQALSDLEATPLGPGEDLTETRFWVLEQQFLVLERQIEHAIQAGASPPPGTWQALHGRYQYLQDWVDRGNGAAPGAGPAADSHLHVGYRRLLLLGIVAWSAADELTRAGFSARLRKWAAETRLEADPAVLEPFAWVVDPVLDGPPCEADSSVALGARAFVLVPPPGFLTLVQASGWEGKGTTTEMGFG